MITTEALNYKDVCLVPNYFDGESRSTLDTSIEFLGYKFKTNFLPANMAAVISEDICKWLSINGYFYIMHRFSDTRKFIQRARSESWPFVSISVGVQESDKELIQDIKQSKCRVHVITVDIAHGFSKMSGEMVKYIKENLPDVKIIVGNVWGNRASIEYVEKIGADAIKVGLSCGKGCSTFATTGFGSPMFSAALESGVASKLPVILDGGVREPADIAKAIVGFTCNQNKPTYGGFSGGISWNFPINVPMVMIGSLFSACVDSPGENVYCKEVADALKSGYSMADIRGVDGDTSIKFKKYYGSASAENKKKTGQEIKHVEGISVNLPCNGLTYAEYYDSLTQAVQSQISYSGGKTLSDMCKVKWKIIK